MCGPPLQLLATLGHEPCSISDLSQEGLDVGGRIVAGSLRQPQRDPSVEAPPPNGLQRRVDRKAPEAQQPASANVGLDPAAFVTPNTGFTVRSHRLPGTPGSRCPGL